MSSSCLPIFLEVHNSGSADSLTCMAHDLFQQHLKYRFLRETYEWIRSRYMQVALRGLLPTCWMQCSSFGIGMRLLRNALYKPNRTSMEEKENMEFGKSSGGINAG